MSKDTNLFISGLVTMAIIGPAICFASPVLGSIVMLTGMFLMIIGAPATVPYGQVSYHSDSHDQHVHFHQHNYPTQRITEGREYSITRTNGETQSLRQIRRIE